MPYSIPMEKTNNMRTHKTQMTNSQNNAPSGLTPVTIREYDI